MIELVPAVKSDYEDIGRLHAKSWQTHYQGIFKEAYLQEDVVSERIRVWRDRLAKPEMDQVVILAKQQKQLLGFICVYLKESETWGALVDNLHVSTSYQGQGIGALLLKEASKFVKHPGKKGAFYLWVLAENHQAIRFYQKMGGQASGNYIKEMIGGGKAPVVRYVWENLEGLL